MIYGECSKCGMWPSLCRCTSGRPVRWANAWDRWVVPVVVVVVVIAAVLLFLAEWSR